MLILISTILLLASFVFKALMDVSGANLFTGDLKHLNREDSWEGKYKKDRYGVLIPYTKKWWHFNLYIPAYEEKFPYSSTMFVALTDYWHFTQFMFLNCTFIAFCIHFEHPILTFIFVRILYAIIFNFTYENTKRNA